MNDDELRPVWFHVALVSVPAVLVFAYLVAFMVAALVAS